MPLRKKIFCRELLLSDMFGNTLRVSLASFLREMTTQAALSYFGLIVLLLATTDPHDYREAIELWGVILFWPCVIAIYVAVHASAIAATSALHALWRPFTTYIPILGAISFVTTFILGEYIVVGISGGAYQTQIFPSIFVLFFGAQAMEQIYLMFVRRQTVKTPAAPTMPKEQTNFVTLGHRNIPSDRIRHIVSEEHYVRVTTFHDVILHRARLADLIKTIPDNVGLQPHRSWWVGRDMQPRLQKTSERQTLLLQDGTIVPVARARQQDVQDWLDKYGH